MSERIKGKDWTFKIYFFPNADKDSGGSVHPISDDELIKTMSELVDVDEYIHKVYCYNTTLLENQPVKTILYHEFVVFQTVCWWWSIEKYSECINIQRSKQLSAVKEKYRQKFRPQHKSIQLMDEDDGMINIRQLINVLWLNNELNYRYDVLERNCKCFAKVVFDLTTKGIGQYRLSDDTGDELVNKILQTIKKLEEIADQIDRINKTSKKAQPMIVRLIEVLQIGMPIKIATLGGMFKRVLASAVWGFLAANVENATVNGANLGSDVHIQRKYNEAITAKEDDKATCRHFLDDISYDKICKSGINGWERREPYEDYVNFTTKHSGDIWIHKKAHSVLFPSFEAAYDLENDKKAEEIRKLANKLREELPDLREFIDEVNSL